MQGLAKAMTARGFMIGFLLLLVIIINKLNADVG